MSQRRVVMFSGGLGSWATAARVADRCGTKDLVLLFSDTKMEDPDLYRFLRESAGSIGGKLVVIEDGRDPWQVFHDVRFMGNTRADPCSRILKRDLCRKWLKENCDPDSTTVYVGFGWNEIHRFEKALGFWATCTAEAPMTEPPYLDHPDIVKLLIKRGIRQPRLYEMGFPHNNCGGFCIKAGQAHFRHLLRMLPERYAYHEQKEEELRQHLGKDVSILRDRTHRPGEQKTRPMTLRTFRKRVESEGESFFDKYDWGGCGCFSAPDGDESPEAA